MGCKECGKPKCNGECGCKSPKVLQINNPAEYITFHKVSIPAAMGDSTTNPPKIGAYRNALAYYEADHTSWMYSTDGIPTKLTNGLTDYNEAVNLPQINGHTLIGNQSSSDLGLQGELTAGANIQINNNVISATDTTYTAGNGIDLDGTEIKAKIGDGLEFDNNGEIDIADIEQYAHFFDNVAEMKSAENLVNGSYAQTYGFYSLNDGGGAKYIIRDAEENETPNGITTFAVDSLIAELVTYGEYVNMKQLGMNASNVDNASILQYAVTNYPASTILYIPQDGDYTFLSAIDCSNKAITIKGTANAKYDEASATTLYFPSSNGFTSTSNTKFEGLAIKGDVETRLNTGIGGGAKIENCFISYFAAGIDVNYRQTFIKGTSIHGCSGSAITNPLDSRIINNTIFANDGSAIKLEQGANDNIITDNKIEWNTKWGILTYNVQNNLISNNIIDRSGWGGLILDGPQCNGNIITNNLLRRNGALDASTYQYNIKLNNIGSKNIIDGNITRIGNSKDDGTGITVPKYGIMINDCNTTLIYLANNVFTDGGYTSDVAKFNSTNVHILDRSNPVYDNLVIKNKSITLNPNGTVTFALDLDSLPADYAIGKSRKIVVNYRTTDDAAYGSKIINAYAYKQYNSYHLSLDNTAISSTITASGSYTAEDGFLITFTSTSSKTFQIQCTEYTC